VIALGALAEGVLAGYTALSGGNGADVIALRHKLNRELTTTLIIVTHGPAVARQTKRVLMMASPLRKISRNFGTLVWARPCSQESQKHWHGRQKRGRR